MKATHTIFFLFLGLTIFLSGCLLNGNTTEKYFEKAEEYASNGYNDAALIELKKALDLSPAHIPSLLLFDKITTGSNKSLELLPYFSRARQAGIEDSRILETLAEAYLDQQQFQNALDQLQKIVSISPDSKELTWHKLMLARAYSGLGKFSDAEEIYSKLLEDPSTLRMAQIGLGRISIQKITHTILYHPSHLNIKLPGNHYLLTQPVRNEHSQLTPAMREILLSGQKNLKQVLEILPESIDANLNLAEIYYLQGKYIESVKFANLGLALDIRNIRGLSILAKSNTALGFYKAAEQNLSQSLAIDESNLETINALVSLYLRRNNTKDAISLLKPHLQQELKNEDLTLNMGIAELINNQPEKALHYLKQAVEIFPKSGYAHALLATAYLMLREREQAIIEFKEARYSDIDNLEISLALIQTNLIYGQYPDGLRIAKTVASQHPDSPSPRHIQGFIYATRDNKQRAKEEYNEALSINPRYFPSRIQLARLSMKDEDILSAEELLNKGLEIEPGHVVLSTEYALLEKHKGEYENAQKRLESISNNNPDELQPRIVLGQHYLEIGAINAAIKIKNELSRLNLLTDEVVLFFSKLYEKLGNTSNEIKMYQILVNRAPGNPHYNQLLGHALTKNRDFSMARTHLQKGARIVGQESPSSLVSLTKLELHQGNLDAARAHIQTLRETSPDNIERIILSGDLLIKENRHKEAIKEYLSSLKKGKNINLIQKISLAYLHSDQKKAARNFLQKWSKRLPDNLDISLAYINHYQQTGNPKTAIAECDRFLKHQPENALILNKLAQLYHQQDKNKAWDYARDAYEITTDSPDILDTYGRMCIERNRYAEGIDTLKKAVVAAPKIPSYQYHLAQGLNQSGKTAIARKLLRSALAIEHPFSERAQAEDLLAELDSNLPQ